MVSFLEGTRNYRRRFRDQTRNRSGFTLVELLVVILIIGILLAIALPTFLNQQDKANNTKTLVALNTTYKVARSVATGQNGKFIDADHDLADMETALRKSEPELTFALSSATIGTIAPDDAATLPVIAAPDNMITDTVYLTSDTDGQDFYAAALSQSGDLCTLKVSHYSKVDHLGCSPADGNNGDGTDNGGSGDDGDGGSGDDGSGDGGQHTTGEGLTGLIPPAGTGAFYDSSQWGRLTTGTAWNGPAAIVNGDSRKTTISGGGLPTGSGKWTTGLYGSSISGAYWTTSVSAGSDLGFATELQWANPDTTSHTDSYKAIWAAMPSPGGATPAASESGYQLAWIKTASTSYTIELSRWDSGEQHVLDSTNVASIGKVTFALLVNPSDQTVSAWYLNDGGSIWTEYFSVNDSTYSSGYAGVEGVGQGTGESTSNFAAGPLQ